MTTSQSFLPYDSSNITNYKAWAQGIGAGLVAVGYQLQSDSGTVNWANVTVVPSCTGIGASYPRPLSCRFQGAFSAGTAYAGSTAAGATNDIVTSAGLTWICLASCSFVLTNFLQNTAQTFSTITSVANASSNTTVYTGTSLGTAVVGYIYVVTGAANGANNGTFMCTATGSTTITLSNPNGQSAAAQTITATSAATNGSINNSTQAIFSTPSAAGNAYVGLSFTTTGFVNAGNNTTFTVTASSGNWIGGVISGTTETHAGLATMASTPVNASVPVNLFWVQYNYEVYKSTDSASSTNPIYIRIAYCPNATSAITSPAPSFVVGTQYSTSGTATGTVTGNCFNSAGAPPEFAIQNGNAASTTLAECDFQSSDGGSLCMILWRNVNTTDTFILVIDRARDNVGNALDSFFSIFATSAFVITRYQIVFKPGIGSVLPSGGWSTGIPSIAGGAQTSWNCNGSAPFLPVFPLPGYVANPCLQMGKMQVSDCVEGSLVNAILYGGSHTFMATKANTSTLDGLNTSNTALLIRWE